jgi:signal transduction histidine kinase
MSTALRRLLLSQPGRSVVLLFAVTILVPAIVLTAFSVRVVEQDRELAVRRLEQDLETASRQLGELIDRELGGAEAVVRRAAAAGSIAAGDLPDWIREAAAVSGRLAIAIPGRTVWPEHGVAYLPWNLDPASLDRPHVSGAVTLNARAQQLLSANPSEAHRVFAELASLGSREQIASLPAGLVGRYGMCATSSAAERVSCATKLYSALARGDWLIEKPRYLFYRSEALHWIGNTAVADDRLEEDRAVERRRRELADALAGGPEAPDAIIRIQVQPPSAASASGADERRPAVLAVRRDWLEEQWWPSVVAKVDRNISATVVDEGNMGRSASDDGQATRITRHTLGDHHWRMMVTHRDMRAALAAGLRERRVNLALLGCVLLLLASGTYFTGRILRRELEIGRMQSDFISAVSHEFRSPLTGIRQLSELLVRDRVSSDERRREYYGRIAEESDRLARVVDNILDFSAIESGRKRLEVQPIDTSAWLRSLAERYRHRRGEAAASLEVRIPEIGVVLGDVEALTSAVDNLVDNAIKYSPNDHPIRFSADQRGDTVLISIEDSGIGIAPEDRPHIFERFYRGTTDATRVARGTGIGLSLVDHIVRAHRGRVDVVSHPGRGSTFTIVLPARASEGRV